jgi:hypothetical protein
LFLSIIIPLLLTSFIIGAPFGKIVKLNLLFSSNWRTRLKFVDAPNLLSHDGFIALRIFLL